MSAPGVAHDIIFEQLEASQVLSYAIISGTALLVYSWLILLGREIRHIWMEPRRGASWLYVAIRYPGLVGQLISTFLTSDTPNCTAVDQIAGWSSLIATFATYAFQVLRTYAVCGRSKYVAVILTMICLPSVVIAIFAEVKLNCYNPPQISSSIRDVSASFDIAFESAVFLGNVIGTWSQVVTARKFGRRQAPIVEAVWSNGIFYFGVFLVVQVTNFITQNISAFSSLVVNFIMSQIQLPVRFSLSCHFLLDIREKSKEVANPSDVSLSTFHTTIGFYRPASDINPEQTSGYLPNDEDFGVERNQAVAES